ncbi:NADPH-dependent FMN reductase [Pandoraea nosoerga]|uniref:FMN reductase (NADPH) n=1 Tax=Pandoraea nosoerga TaxID=2508296 RepID=A0A5E4TVR3_9BURK|nr:MULTISPECIES: NADPH-dependent FMN reductase [Pandoraea]MBN4665013.1 NADPH-dependent FMN reductase [Pandoraea nosoerga]MBN4675271.1 NADPH-dependent FMN reductase [Pandoraea nosoerga]MBN4680756.1 NADPH-dependent FMN reductase [Pandoraea nosoerga]MBN4744760.1 NADPH-dependent FMN reductase [Pandoraea nosoerga]VVD91621.1 FMN reductase (NADPH) [Pandoraea nosoerga]
MTYAVTISGSPSGASRSARLLRFVEHELAAAGIAVRRIDIRALAPAALLSADTSHDDLRHALAQVAGAQAVVVATPVYKAAYSGLLKAFLDVLPQDGLADKLVAPFATGGSPAHLLALDYALKPVLSALGAQHILRGVFAVDQQVPKEDGALLDSTIAERLGATVDQLSRWLHEREVIRQWPAAAARPGLARATLAA